VGEQIFVAYVGDPDIHDASVISHSLEGTVAVVVLKSVPGQSIHIEFSDAESVVAHKPIGMMLYSLTEFKTAGEVRHFVFANWDDHDERALEIFAEDFRCTKDDSPTSLNASK
jgi:hypothetical protein